MMLIRCLALGFLMTAPLAHAGLIVNGAFARALASGPDVGDDSVPVDDKFNFADWTSSFQASATEGRVSSTADYTFEQDASGFQLDLDHTAAIGSGVPDASAFPADAATNVYIDFTVDSATSYDFSGVFNSSSPGLTFLWFYSVTDAAWVYRDTASASPSGGVGFSYTFGTAPSDGAASGVIGPGNYTITWESHVQRFDDVLSATGDAEFSLKFGSYATVPAPGGVEILALGLLLLARRPARDK